jgi:Zn-dependent oligopeptidase
MFSRKSSIIQSPRSKSQKKSMFSRLTSRFQTKKSRYPSIRESSIQLQPAISKEEIQKEIQIVDNIIALMRENYTTMLTINNQEMPNAVRLISKAKKRLDSAKNSNNHEQIAINKQHFQEALKNHTNLVKELDEIKDNIDLFVKLKNELEEKIRNNITSRNKSGGTRKRRKYKNKKH